MRRSAMARPVAVVIASWSFKSFVKKRSSRQRCPSGTRHSANYVEYESKQHITSRTDLSFANTHKEWDDRIEVAYLSVAALQTVKSQTSKVAIISPGEPFHVKETRKDWVMDWYVVREKGLTLFGPPPKTLIEPISKEEFMQAVKEHTKAWCEWIQDMRKRKQQAYAVLTLCRVLYAYRNGEQASKKQAALWAEKELPAWSQLIQNALVWREDWRNEQVDHETTLAETVK